MKTVTREATPSTKELLVEIASLKTALMRCEAVIAEMAERDSPSRARYMQMKTVTREATPSTKELLVENASLKTALMRCEATIAEQTATIKDLKTEMSELRHSVLDAGWEAIQANDRSQKIEQQLQQMSERNNRTLADRIREHIRKAGVKSLRSSAVRKIFGIAHHSQSNVAMKRVAALCPDIKLTEFRSRHGAELALVVV